MALREPKRSDSPATSLAELVDVIEKRAAAASRQATSRTVAPHVHGVVRLKTPSGTCDIRVDRGVPSLTLDSDSPSATIEADTTTLARLVAQEESGIEAFLRGKLKVRGNLALALQLGGLFDKGDRPKHFFRPGWIDASGIKSFYLEAGEGPTVVLLHGLGATNASFLPTLSDLAVDHHVIAPDFPGFGESGKPIRKYHATFYARWLREFLLNLSIPRVHVVGNSMGGRVAIEMALRFPDMVDKIVLLCPAPAFIKGRSYVPIVRWLRPELAMIPTPMFSHRQVVRGVRSMFSRPQRLPDTWYDAAADEFMRVFRNPAARIGFFSASRQIYLEEPFGEKGFWDRLPTMTTPALFVWGERDRLVPAAFARHVVKALPNAHSVVLPDCGHVPQFELPDRTNELIRNFIDAG